ncbi:MAG: NAD(P)-binding protein [Reyranellaceae bacterium]
MDYEVIVIGAGVAGIYQIKRLAELGVNATVLEAGGDLGGTWYWNRYPGARFDSESYTYDYSFSRELLDEWRGEVLGQPEGACAFAISAIAEKFDLRRFMQFDCRGRAGALRRGGQSGASRSAMGAALTCAS